MKLSVIQFKIKMFHRGFMQVLVLHSLKSQYLYWLQAPWEWHDSVETGRSVIICEIIVRLLVTVQNEKGCTVQVLKQN